MFNAAKAHRLNLCCPFATPFPTVVIPLLVSGLLSAAQSKPVNTGSSTPSVLSDPNDSFATFTDIASSAGLTDPIFYGGLDQKKYIIETNGCGVAFLDYDNDGWMDIFLLNGTRLEGVPKSKRPTNKAFPKHPNR